jgi:hypothetical protein
MTRLCLPVLVVILILEIFCDVAMESTITDCVYFKGRHFLLLPLIYETSSLTDLCIALPFLRPFTHGSTGRTLRHTSPPYSTYSLPILIHYPLHISQVSHHNVNKSFTSRDQQHGVCTHSRPQSAPVIHRIPYVSGSASRGFRGGSRTSTYGTTWQGNRVSTPRIQGLARRDLW